MHGALQGRGGWVWLWTVPPARFRIDSGPLVFARVSARAAEVAGTGGMAEWTNATVLKTVIPARVSWVRIPLPPPLLDIIW